MTQLRACAKYHMETSSKVGKQRRREAPESPGGCLEPSHPFISGIGGDNICTLIVHARAQVCACMHMCTLNPEVGMGCLTF